MTNQALRDHVTSAAFVLHLGKTHVAALVRLDLELAAETRLTICGKTNVADLAQARLHRHDHTGYSGLISRGLVVHVFHQNSHKYVLPEPSAANGHDVIDYDAMPPGDMWNITPAGRLVCDLLKEAGIYQEYAGPLMPLIELAKAGKRARRREAS